MRLVPICYDGIGLTKYTHGITPEIWHMARASRAFHGREATTGGSEGLCHRLLAPIAEAPGVRVPVDIVAGASARGANGVFPAHAVASGQSLRPSTDLWLETADRNVYRYGGAADLAPRACGPRPSARWAVG